MGDTFKQEIRNLLIHGEQPDLRQVEELLFRLEKAESMLSILSPALGDAEKERDAYALLAQSRAEFIEQMQKTLNEQNFLYDHNSLEQPQHGSQNQVMKWRYNLREFFEMNTDGWRAIVSSDSEDSSWMAYIEQSGVRFYATQKYAFVQDALWWCSAEIACQLDSSKNQQE